MPVFFQIFPPFLIVWHQTLYAIPKPWGMVRVNFMGQFMKNYIFDDSGRSHAEPEV